jgi:hypothetical protein
LAGATRARRGATRALLLDFGFKPVAVAGAVPFSSGIDVVIFYSPLEWFIFTVTTSITQVRLKCKSIRTEVCFVLHLLVGWQRASM